MEYNKSVIFVILCIFLFSGNVICQDTKNKTGIDAGANLGFKFSPNGHTFGTILYVSYPLWLSKNGFLSLSSGLHEDFQVQLERGFEGTSGSTITNASRSGRTITPTTGSHLRLGA